MLQAHPELGKQIAADEHTDAEMAILKQITADLQPNTNMIRVSLTSSHDDNLAAIVNGVIEAYLAVANDFNEEGAAQRALKLRSLASSKESQVRTARTAFSKPSRQGRYSRHRSGPGTACRGDPPICGVVGSTPDRPA